MMTLYIVTASLVSIVRNALSFAGALLIGGVMALVWSFI